MPIVGHLDVAIIATGLIVGFVVGLTGMGGGALMTPILVLFFGIQPLAAVSSDLVAALVMRPVGGVVHLRRGTVHRGLVAWLCVGSVPAAFLGVVVLRAIGDGSSTQAVVKTGLGIALLLATAAIAAKALLSARHPDAEEAMPAAVAVRRAPTLAIGALGGLIVGLTSVGSGSLMIVMLLFLYPALSMKSLVGTDLVQAVPLVASAALGHLLFGHVELGLTAALLIGSIPGVYVGARVSVHAPSLWVRRALTYVLLASALKLLDVPTLAVGYTLIAIAVLTPLGWLALRPLRRPRPPVGLGDPGGGQSTPRIIPAATVPPVPSSIRMKLPVVRLRR